MDGSAPALTATPVSGQVSAVLWSPVQQSAAELVTRQEDLQPTVWPAEFLSAHSSGQLALRSAPQAGAAQLVSEGTILMGYRGMMWG